MSLNIKIKLLNKEAQLPTKSHVSDAGMDLYATEDIAIKKGERQILPIGIAASIPEGYFVSIRDRSGLAAKNGLHVLAGVIDCDYRGEWKVIIVNLGEEDYAIKKGERVAQAVLHEVPELEISEVDELEETKRGEGGLGSTGK